MNERGVEVLIGAALRGVRQIKWLSDGQGGRCARGVLAEAVLGSPDWALRSPLGEENKQRIMAAFDLARVIPCPFGCRVAQNEFYMLSHLNDDHNLDFISIARKLEPDVSGAGA